MGVRLMNRVAANFCCNAAERGSVEKVVNGVVSFWRGWCRTSGAILFGYTFSEVSTPLRSILNFDLTLNSKAGRKSGDKSGPSTDHRENKQTLTKASRTV